MKQQQKDTASISSDCIAMQICKDEGPIRALNIRVFKNKIFLCSYIFMADSFN